MKLPKFTALFLAGALTLSVAACGKPSVDSSDKRYKANKDKISVLITKQPANKVEFEKKAAEFEAEYTAAMAAGSDEEKIKKLGELNSRMDKYLAEFDKKDAKKDAGGAAAPSNKLDKTGGTAPAAAPAAGGKLGGPAGGTAPAQPASGGMGGGAPAQPASGGMGGGAPAGGTAPAQPAGGMGGM